MDQQNITRSVARLGIAALLIYGLYAILAPFVFPIIIGGILSILSRPLYKRLLTTLHNPSLTSALTITVLSIVVLLPLGGVFALLIQELSIASANLSNNPVSLESLNNSVRMFTESLGITSINSQEYLQKALSFVSDRSVVVLGNAVNTLITLFIALITTFYLLQSHDSLRANIVAFSPLSIRDTEHIFARTRQVVQATVSGNLVLIGLQSLVTTLGFIIFGISSPLLGGALYGIASLIPGIGSALVWVPVALFQLAQGNTIAALGICCWSITQILLLDNIVGPKLIENRANLHPFLILLGVLGGVSSFGIVGIVIGPTIIALGIVGLELLSRTWQSHPA